MKDVDRRQKDPEERPPGFLLMAMELRALWEFGAGVAAAPILAQAPKGDGHPVLVLPGLAAGDLSTTVLRQFLALWGYAPYGWRQGLNFGPRPGVVESGLARLRDLHERCGRKVSIIGWSLGGTYAREFAKEAPECVRQVITLGAAFAAHPKTTNAWRLFELATGQMVDDPELHEPLRGSPPVPTTSIWSRTDGVVSWKCSVEPSGEQTENIVVCASHMGLGTHPAVLYAIADRLSQPEGEWRPFDRGGMRRLVYGDPEPSRRWFGLARA
jgi:hypothetical protein